MDKAQKIYTCTPRSFQGDDNFFSRDTGLFCKTMLSMGIESKSIVLLPHHKGDLPEHLIRTTLSNLQSVKWWKSLQLDGVILYSWGMPRYTLIARAIKKAGIRLVIHMDASGNFDKLLPEEWTPLKGFLKYIYAAVKNIFRSKHLGYADVITMSPVTAEAISKMLFMKDSIIKKNYPCACPVSPDCSYSGKTKEDVIMCVGRWDDERQKRSRFMMKALAAYYQRGGKARTLIYGHITQEMSQWHENLPDEFKNKIELGGFISNNELVQKYQSAKCILCPSSYESSHITSTEGLCSGCSIVVTNRPSPLRVVHWYTSRNSGTISKEDTPESFAEAIFDELKEWEQGNRDPWYIAETWSPHFHADKVVRNIFTLCDK